MSAATPARDNIALLLGWLHALADQDRETVMRALHPDVVWQGVREDLVCDGADAVAAAFLDAAGEEAELRSLEIVGAPSHVVLAVHRPDLTEIEGVELHGRIHSVFTIDGHRITRIRDYADREEALRAAGLPGTVTTGDPLIRAAVEAIHSGDVAALERLLRDHPELATARLGDERTSRTLLHVATDWPGHFPNGPASVAALVAAGADVDAPFVGDHAETPLHWAASSDDVDVLDALIDAGADVEAPGGVIAGGTPLTDAVAFGQWRAARRLVAAGAQPTFREAAALGLTDLVRRRFAEPEPPTPDELAQALWYACHGGQREAVEYLLERGADLNWVSPWDGLTPLDAARRSDAAELADWLASRGGRSSSC